MSYASLLNELGCSYLGKANQSAKMSKSYINGEYTYGLYLAPSDLSGHNVCPKSEHCRAFCLNGSGRNIGDNIVHEGGLSNIDRSRIKKTRLFYDNREAFMDLLIHEINKSMVYAKAKNMGFSVRLNCTSDLSPLVFKKDGYNILDLFPNVQFYDYTKVLNRFNLMDGYHKNYDLTFSYDGYNGDDCEYVLNSGLGRVAVVFYGGLPKRFCGYDVIDGNLTDIRFRDPKGVIVGLHYHRTYNDYKVINGKRVFIAPNTPFVIMPNDQRSEW